MRKFLAMFLVCLMVASSVSVAPAWAAECEDTILDKVWDWVTTLGKEGLEKDKILAKNKAERLKRCAEKKAKEAKKKLGF